MQNSNFQLILTEKNGNFAMPDITITSDLQTVFALINSSDISQRKDAITQSITLPGTKNNDRIFNNLYSLNRFADSTLEETLFYNFSPVVGVRAVLYENNYPIMSGTLTIQQISKDKKTGAFSYTGIITGNLVNFFGRIIADTLIENVPLFTQTPTYTWDAIQSSWDWNADDVYFYPAIDYGNGIVPTITSMDLRNFRVAIYLRQMLRAIFKYYGYKIKSDFIDSDYFNRAFVPFAELNFGENVSGDVIDFHGVAIAQQNMNADNASTCLTGVFYNDLAANPYVTYGVGSAHGINGGWGRKTVINDRNVSWFQFEKAAFTGANFEFNFDIFSHAKTTAVYVQIFKFYDSIVDEPFIGKVDCPNTFDADSALATYSIGFGTEAKLVWTNIQGNVVMPVDNYPIGTRFGLVISTVTDKGDDLQLRQNNTVFTLGNPDVTVDSNFAYDIGDTYNLNDQTPKSTKVVDFLKGVFTNWNMYILQDPSDDQQLLIEPYDMFYAKAYNPADFAIDWTKKVDNSSLDISINSALPLAYGFKFDTDSDYYNTLYSKSYGISTNTLTGLTYPVNYGDLLLNNPLGTAPELDITSIFSGTPVVTENKDDKTYPAIFDGDLTTKKPMKSKLRVLFNNGSRPCAPYSVVITQGNVQDGITYETRETGITTFNASHHVLTLDGVDVFNLVFGLPKAVFYTAKSTVFTVPVLYSMFNNQLRELDDINIFTLSLDVHLRDVDIAALDLTCPIMISTVQGTAYFKIISVTYFNSNELSQVVLQKIIIGDLGASVGVVVPPPPPPPVVPGGAITVALAEVGDACAAPPFVIYIDKSLTDITTGTALFWDAALTWPVRDYAFIKGVDGRKYSIDQVNGTVDTLLGSC